MSPIQSSTLEISKDISPGEVIELITSQRVGSDDVKKLKDLMAATDKQLAAYLNVSEKTVRNYKMGRLQIKPEIQERVVLLTSLFNHGINVFGNVEDFNKWLGKENFFLDGRTPNSFLHIITGIQFVDSRLTAMEYGDNV